MQAKRFFRFQFFWNGKPESMRLMVQQEQNSSEADDGLPLQTELVSPSLGARA